MPEVKESDSWLIVKVAQSKWSEQVDDRLIILWDSIERNRIVGTAVLKEDTPAKTGDKMIYHLVDFLSHEDYHKIRQLGFEYRAKGDEVERTGGIFGSFERGIQRIEFYRHPPHYGEFVFRRGDEEEGRFSNCEDLLKYIQQVMFKE